MTEFDKGDDKGSRQRFRLWDKPACDTERILEAELNELRLVGVIMNTDGAPVFHLWSP
jgi:hypothetical protein